MANFIRPWCKHFQGNDMPEEHVCDAPFALIGEAPGSQESQHGKPFIGPSGWLLSQWWREVGLRREQFYIDNCYPAQPLGNVLETVSEADLIESTRRMLARLRKQKAKVVVPTGNTSLRAILGDPRARITDWRGSILFWEERKCIPTIHPAAALRQRVLSKLCLADWKRIEEEGRTDNPLPRKELLVRPSYSERASWALHAKEYFSDASPDDGPPRVLSVDVENLRGGSRALQCVGLSFQAKEAVTVSVVRSDYESDRDWRAACVWVRDMLSCEYSIVGQNFMTDLFKLVAWEPSLRRPLQRSYAWDLMEMAHLLDPNDGGDTQEGSEEELREEGLRVGMLDLATLTSLYTREPFYKWMGSSPYWETRAAYNAMDAAVQREIFPVLWKRLRERQLV